MRYTSNDSVNREIELHLRWLKAFHKKYCDTNIDHYIAIAANIAVEMPEDISIIRARTVKRYWHLVNRVEQP